MNTSTFLRRVLPALLIVAIAVGVFFWTTRAKPVNVVLKTVDRGNVESTVVNTRAGTVEACLRTKLSTIMGGRIEFLGVKEGDKVKKGQLLLKLWNDDQKAQQTLAEAQRASAVQRVKEVCTTAASSLREAERQTSLRGRGFVSEAKEDSARSEADARSAACNTARADIVQADARINVTKVEQGRMTLYAPFDGTVAKIVGELGEYSTPSPPGVPTPPAIDLIDDSCLYINAPMDEVDAPKIKAGLPVRVSLDAMPKKPLKGKVRRVAPYVVAVEKQARTVDVEVDFEMPATGNLLVGYSADVEIVLDTRTNVLRVPTAALIEGGRVMVLNLDTGKLEERKVKTGTANWEFTEIVEGLTEGERIVTSLEREGVKVGARATAATADEKSK
ncbi:MAG: efflux RND transporter periplasmic adaptor subunit [Rhodocyclales bacterium]|nr:efflux RND transporter periplasmic adaptor subunit [Rhodocyclales bacterium]